MAGAEFAQHVINGLTSGSVYALIALGYTLIFGVMKLIFFAQGDLCMVGAFGAFALLTWLGPFESPLVGTSIAVVGAAAAAVVIGLLAERLAIRPIRSAPRTKQLIASLGVSMILQNAALLGISSQFKVFPQTLPTSVWSVGSVTITATQACILLSAILLMGGLHYVLRSTRVGLQMRAVADSPIDAELDGIDVGRTVSWTFGLGAGLAGFAGVMMGLYDGVIKYDMGFLPGIKGFTAAILGGFGSPIGAMLGGLLLGLSESMASGYISARNKDVVAFIVLVLVLIVRPSGLIGRRGMQ